MPTRPAPRSPGPRHSTDCPRRRPRPNPQKNDDVELNGSLSCGFQCFEGSRRGNRSDQEGSEGSDDCCWRSWCSFIAKCGRNAPTSPVDGSGIINRMFGKSFWNAGSRKNRQPFFGRHVVFPPSQEAIAADQDVFSGRSRFSSVLGRWRRHRCRRTGKTSGRTRVHLPLFVSLKKRLPFRIVHITQLPNLLQVAVNVPATNRAVLCRGTQSPRRHPSQGRFRLVSDSPVP